jgi:PAS domain S-box-containing protein
MNSEHRSGGLLTERALHENEERFRLMTDSAPVLIWISGPDKLCTWFNKGWLDFVGRSMEQELGNGWTENIHADDLDRCLQTYNTSFDERRPFSMEYRLERHDGEYRWLLDRGIPLFGSEGEFTGYIGSCVDITERKRAEEARLETEERHRLALEAGQMGTWEWDMVTNQVTWSAALEAIHGFAPATFPGTFAAYQKDIHPDDRDYVTRTIARNAAHGDDHQVEYRIVRRDGVIRWVEGRGRVFRDESGRPTRMIGVCTDVTERKQSEAALLEADRRKDEFLAVLAHELRNPLTPVRNAAHVLKREEWDDPRVRQAVDMIERQVTHMARLIEDLLEVSRIATGALTLRLDEVNFNEVIRGALDACRGEIEARGHALRVHLPAMPVRVRADRDRMIQVLCNLISNAAKYTPTPDGVIDIRAEVGGDRLEIAVRDNGRGIPAAKLSEIFELFVQVDRSLERQGGLGIGLTLARQLVELHGGSIEARSDGENRGSTFLVRLPVVASEMRKAAARPGPLERSTEPRRVLVVDDSEDAALSLGLILQTAGHATRVALDGASALEAAREFRPELAFLDIGMPRMNGYELARKIRGEAWGKSIRLVAVTGWGQERDRQQAKEAGFDAHLVKPADPLLVTRLVADDVGAGLSGD